MTINWVDFIVAGFLIFTTVKGLFRGLIRCLLDVVAIFFSIFLAFYFNNALTQYLLIYIQLPKEIISVTTFILIWGVTMFAFLMIGNLLHKFIGRTIFGPINLIGGALFGAVKGLLIFWIFLFFLSFLPIPQNAKQFIFDSPSVKVVQPVIKLMNEFIVSYNPKAMEYMNNYFFNKDIKKEQKIKNRKEI